MGYRPRRSLHHHRADAHIGAGRLGSSAEMGSNSVRGERGGFVPAEAAAEDHPLLLGTSMHGLGEQDPKPHTPPPLGGGGGG